MAPPAGAVEPLAECAVAEFVSPESFQRALQGLDTQVIRDIGRRLETKNRLLARARQQAEVERRVLLQESAELKARIAATIQSLASPEPPSGFDWGTVMSYLAVPCVAPAPASPGASAPGTPTAAQVSVSGSLRASALRLPRGASDEKREEREELVDVGIGARVGRQLSDAWSLLAQGDLPCTTSLGSCCEVDSLDFVEVRRSAQSACSPLSTSVSSECRTSGDDGPLSPPGRRHRTQLPAAGFAPSPLDSEAATWRASSMSPKSCLSGPQIRRSRSLRSVRSAMKGEETVASQSSRSSSPASRLDGLQIHRHRSMRSMRSMRSERSARSVHYALASTQSSRSSSLVGQRSMRSMRSMRSVRSVQRGEEPLLEGGAFETVWIEAELKMGSVYVGLCQVGATDECGDVATRFVAEHALGPDYEAPLTEYLLSLEAGSDEFPVLVSADLDEIKEQFSDAI